MKLLRERPGSYDPKVLDALASMIGKEAKYVVKELRLRELKESMILAEGIRSAKGILLIAHGQEITRTLLLHLNNFADTQGIREPIKAIIPLRQEPEGLTPAPNHPQ